MAKTHTRIACSCFLLGMDQISPAQVIEEVNDILISFSEMDIFYDR